MPIVTINPSTHRRVKRQDICSGFYAEQGRSIKKVLRDRLANAKKIAVLGIGSDLRGDDGAGMLACEELDKKLSRAAKKKIGIFFGSTAPENLTGEIKRYKPDHLLMIDTIEISQKPGTMLVVASDEIGENVSFSTHKIPSKILADYFKKSLGCKITMVGVQPANIDFGKKMSKTVKSACKEIAIAIKDASYGK